MRYKAKILLITLSVFLVSFAVFGYNRFIDRLHLLHIANGRVEAELQRRYIVNSRSRAAAEQYLETEGKIQEHLIELNRIIRSGGQAGRQAETENELVGLVERLDVLKEEYPGLRTKGPYLFLMETIQDSGWRVTREKFRYNEAVYDYNLIRHIFPFKPVAFLFGFHEESFMKAEKGAERVPGVGRS